MKSLNEMRQAVERIIRYLGEHQEEVNNVFYAPFMVTFNRNPHIMVADVDKKDMFKEVCLIENDEGNEIGIGTECIQFQFPIKQVAKLLFSSTTMFIYGRNNGEYYELTFHLKNPPHELKKLLSVD